MKSTLNRGQAISDPKAVIAVYNTHPEAEAAVKELQRGGFNMKKLSVVGKDYHTDEQVVGYYNAGDRMKYWGKWGALWGGLWGLLFGAAFFWVPGVGPLLVAGPLSAAIVASFESARRGGWFERPGSCPLEHWHTQRQRFELRNRSQGEQVSPRCPRD